jgi:hypothetical protein
MSENITGRVRLPQGFDSQAESVLEGTLVIEQGSLTFPDGTFFTSSIDTTAFVTTSSFNAFTATYNSGSFSGSFRGDGSGLTGIAGGGSTNTGSLLLTASVALNTITFTKGNGSTFPITVNTGSGGGTVNTSSFATTGSNTFKGNQVVSGSIVFGDGSLIQSISASSGDGFGYTTLTLKPDTSIVSDQYIVLDPTAPNHIHIRAGGLIDSSSAYLYLGGEKANVVIQNLDGSFNEKYRVAISSQTGSTQKTWLFDDNGILIAPGEIQAPSFTGSFTGSLQGTASFATTASFTTGIYAFNYTASFTNQSTWTVNHNLGTRTVLIQAFDNNYQQIVPQNITLTNSNTATITFPTAETGFAVASVGGAYNIATASVATLATLATTASYVTGSIFNSSNPALSASFAVTSSYILNAVSSSFAITASIVPPYEGAWISYTPVWTANVTNPVIGNGSLQGWYRVIGKTCFVRGNIVMGTTTTFGSGEWYVSMPFTASHADAILMTVNLLDNGSAWYNAVLNGARAGFNNRAPMQYQAAGGTALDVNATQPFTWTSTDRFIWNGSYEIV